MISEIVLTIFICTILYTLIFIKNKNYNPIIISIDGNIGSGKSTLVQLIKNNAFNKLLKNVLVVAIDEPVKIWINTVDNEGKNLLENFYNDKKRWAYSFQNYAYITRIKLLLDAVDKYKSYNKPVVIITERSQLTDRNVFAKMLYDGGYINELEKSMYDYWYHTFDNIININNIIYLNTPPETCLQRIKKRGREEEKNLAEDTKYITDVHKYHQNWLSNHNNSYEIDGTQDFEKDLDHQKHVIGLVANYINKLY